MKYPHEGRRWSESEWAQARGLGTTDYNGSILLVRSPVERVAGVIADDAETWVPDILGRTVIRRPDDLFVFRLCGHAWSIILSHPYARVPYGAIGHEWERSLSVRLGTGVIEYGVSDTCGSIGYTWVEDGEVVEEFYAEDDGSRPAPDRSRFSSIRRDVSLSQIENIYKFVDEFFVERDAYDPGIEFDYFFGHDLPKPGIGATVSNPGFVTVYPEGEVRNIPAMERVDYVTLKPKQRRISPSAGREIPPERPEAE